MRKTENKTLFYATVRKSEDDQTKLRHFKL